MPSLLITVLFLNVIIYVVNTVGAATVDGLLWLLYIQLPTGTSQIAREQRHMKREVVQLKHEMSSTSSQDEFAKWAKLRRRHDKALEAYEAKNNELTQSKSTFDMTIKIARWAATSGLMLFLQFWYSKTPIFTLPPGWIPWQVQWVLSFPRAPMGTVSIQIWGGACATVVALVGDAMKASLAYVSKPKIDRIKLGATMEGKEGKKRQ
ncbi:CHD5 domain-containing protein [Histoplasma capsulatum G186AR]|uniref:Protein GET1 n=2 Tax=Ajellomyces capsulatus TaxID=5037 RepID=GET1_AJECG|nr:CHD5 domain-containing protein [Histoplasma capsulatum G186AR]C0NIJ2.1 RecName: Full=Protein GET1; AltName: Full=Guided entry of tail-anchored proteins 1 [Histoplasma capsulatum G186AR]EEH08712.1 CHD5 domain-containing protein [Histoplasma capsulatum G186AR]KAG5303979.1 CHD5 domain-containing protein [Histoplasma capsulatum]QSS69578.1 CHD5 domain-containing protein [Histoplasma capsulatum G186AR]